MRRLNHICRRLTARATVAVLVLSLLPHCGDSSRRTAHLASSVGKEKGENKMTDKNPLDNPAYAAAVFFPRPDMPFGPEAKGARDHLFELEQGVRSRLRLFFAESTAPTILFFHGNGETGRDYDLAADEFRAVPVSLAVAEYRGYGPSTGNPSLRNILRDAHRTLDELKKILVAEKRSGPLIVMGRSLGSAPAIELASSRSEDVDALIVESGFARVVPLLELVGVPARSLGIEEAHGPQNLEKIGRVTMPTLIMHAADDEIIPFGDAELLLQARKAQETIFLKVPRAGHNDIQLRAGTSYFEHIAELVKLIE